MIHRIKWIAIMLPLLIIAMAHADLKTVSEVVTTGVPPALKNRLPGGDGTPQIVTTYYKANRQRVEQGDSVTIYDGITDTLYTLNPAKRTYTAVNVKAVAEGMPASMMAFLDIKVTANLKPGGNHKTIAGKPAVDYLYTSTVTIAQKNDAAAANTAPPTFVLEGEMWTTDSVKVNPNLLQMQGMGFLRRIPGMLTGSLKPLLDQMAQIKGLPLLNRLRIIGLSGKSTPVKGTTTTDKEPVVTTTEVKTISEEPLSDSLFTIPANYTEFKKSGGG